MDGTARPATTNGGLHFSPDAALRAGCPSGLVEEARRLGLRCTAPPPGASGGMWCIGIGPQDEERLYGDTYRRRRAAGHPLLAIPSAGAQSPSWMPRMMPSLIASWPTSTSETRAEIMAGWRAGRRSLAQAHAIEQRVYRDPPPVADRSRRAPLVRAPLRREARPRARRTAARRALGTRSGQDPGEGDDDSEGKAGGDLAPFADRRRTAEARS